MAQVFDGITVLDFTRGMPGGMFTMVMSHETIGGEISSRFGGGYSYAA